MTLVLNSVEARVLGSLIEKQVTTPDYYPLTQNALVAACNQKNNRDPVMTLGGKDVLGAIDTLRDKRLAWLVDAAGSHVSKYSHNLQSVLAISPQQMALLCELMLRGPQTAAELRLHCERLCQFTDLQEAEAALAALASWPDGALVVKLPREPGCRERRFAHLLCGEIKAPAEPAAPFVTPPAVSAPAGEERITALENEVLVLKKELAELRQMLAEFRKQFE